MFAWTLIRVLAVIGFTLLPLMLVNLWFMEAVIVFHPSTPGYELQMARYGWFRAALNIVVGTITLAFLLALVG